MIKRILSVISAAALLSSPAAVFAETNNDISILVNGTKIETDTAPVIINGRTMVPVRAIAENLGCDVIWDETDQGIIVCRDFHLYTFWIGYDTSFDIYDNAVVLENTYSLESAPIIINDRTMLPVRAVAEMMNAEVGWDDATRTVSINVEQSEPYDYSAFTDSITTYESALYSERDKYKALALGSADTVTGCIVLETGETMDFVLYPEFAEQTVNNFISLAKSGFYNNNIFHRVIEDFVIQGGGFFKSGDDIITKEADTIRGEFLANGYINFLPHTAGALSMARTNDPDSASSQFFICDGACPSLNGQYAVFGYVLDSGELIHELASAETDENDMPLNSVAIKEIIIN